MMRVLGLAAMAAAAFAPASLRANWCATPARGGNVAALAGVVNSYYPATASAARGATTLALGASTGARQAIAAGDLLLVIQMQDAGVNTANGATYGDGATGGGYTDVRGAGRYEYARAGSAVGANGGMLTLVGGAGAGLVNTYANAPSATTTARASFQVVVVPQYNNLSLTGTVAASPWNGGSGGIVAFDVAQRLTFAGGNVSVSGAGFRGGGARQQNGGAGANGDYATSASIAANGAKGEGVAGTPRYVASAGALLDTAVEGYVGGSNGRGAPGNGGAAAATGTRPRTTRIRAAAAAATAAR